MRKLSLIILIIFNTNTYATSLYRHIPFNLSLEAHDTVTVNYDFSEKHGIQCTADNRGVQIDFAYKGRLKTARLPVTLQAAHIPTKSEEELASLSGQFTLYANQITPSVQRYEVSCDYIG